MMRFLRTGVSLILLLATSFALAQEMRPFPPESKRAMMSPSIYPQVVINGQARVLSVNVQIRNQDNLIEMPTSLAAGNYMISYVENDVGEIVRIWLLTADEAKKALPENPNAAPTHARQP